jgi:hypothetical protein
MSAKGLLAYCSWHTSSVSLRGNKASVAAIRMTQFARNTALRRWRDGQDE